MTDRELLELAAKAFEIGKQNPPDNPHCWTASEYPKGSGKHGALWNYVGHGDTAELWNPLSDDGDALRLAVRLEMDVSFGLRGAVIERGHGRKIQELDDDEPYAATRRAIVRAAADIGRSMK